MNILFERIELFDFYFILLFNRLTVYHSAQKTIQNSNLFAYIRTARILRVKFSAK